jgi:hypothetical protein
MSKKWRRNSSRIDIFSITIFEKALEYLMERQGPTSSPIGVKVLMTDVIPDACHQLGASHFNRVDLVDFEASHLSSWFLFMASP